ncbi:MAG: AAA family ATPase [Solirubrobacteraceae bacterium]
MLLEREAALDAVAGVLRAEGGRVLFLIGTAGIGKTSVLEVGRRAALREGLAIASAVGSPMETGLPFGLIGQAMVALGGSEVDDAIDLERLGGRSARVFRTFRRLARVATERRLLLTLDDLHWADPDSLELVGFLCRRLAGIRIVVLGCLRPEPGPASRLARELVGSGHAGLVALEPLSLEAAAQLLGRTVGRPVSPEEGERLWRECAGTPLLLKTAVSQLEGEGSRPVAAAGVSGAFQSDLLLDRFVGFGDAAMQYVRAAAVLGIRFAPTTVGALAGLDDTAAREIHGRLVRAGLLDDLDGGWSRFIHPLFAQALLESQPLSERRRAHAEAFRLLVARRAPDALAAGHAVAAGLIGNELAIEVTTRAGTSAMGLGGIEAAGMHLGNAVMLAGEDAGGELLIAYASTLAAQGRADEAEVVCARLLASSATLRPQALALLARTAILTRRPADAERLYERAAAAAGEVDREAEAATLADAAVTCLVTSPLSWTGGVIARCLASLAEQAPLRRPLELLQAYSSLMSGDPSGQERVDSMVRGWSSRDVVEPGWAWTMAVHALNSCKLTESFELSTALFERELGQAVQDGAPALMIALSVAYADTVHRLGRPREALELVQRSVALADWPMAPWSDLALAVLLTELGQDPEARPHIEVLRSIRAQTSGRHYAPVLLWLDVLDARRLLAEGRSDEASDAMLDAAAIAELTGWRHPCIVPWAGLGLEAHIAAGRLELAREQLERLTKLTGRLRARWPAAAVALGGARLAAARGSRDQADRAFRNACALFGELPYPIHRAEALIAHGGHLRRTGRPREAREPLAQAVELAERSEAARVARLARAELAAAGGRRRRRDGDRSALTAQEQRVASLAAEGMTNAQIAAALYLSPKTVGHHLGSVYGKLRISSRRELIRGSRP